MEASGRTFRLLLMIVMIRHPAAEADAFRSEELGGEGRRHAGPIMLADLARHEESGERRLLGARQNPPARTP
jgi:hypothetical protein